MTDMFDQNFCFPVPPVLENAQLRLIPWNPSLHSPIYVQSIAPHPELFNYLPLGPFDTREAFDAWFEGMVHKQQSQIAFAIFDKTRGSDNEGFAGMIGLLNASPENLSVEIGFLTILPAFQRTHVASNSVGLLLTWLLDPPGPTPATSKIPAGLGLRRVYWSANTLNVRSIALAQRLGLKLEAVFRWDRALPADRVAFGKKEMRKGDPREGHPGRDTARLAICWDDWVNGGREKAHRVMLRVS